MIIKCEAWQGQGQGHECGEDASKYCGKIPLYTEREKERERALLKFSTKIFLSTANSVVETNLGEQK